MTILDESVLDKALTVPEKTSDKNTGTKGMSSSTMDTLNNHLLSFRNSFY